MAPTESTNPTATPVPVDPRSEPMKRHDQGLAEEVDRIYRQRYAGDQTIQKNGRRC